MQIEVPDAAEKAEIARLVREKSEIEAKLAAVGGRQFSFLLEDCADLSDIIENIREVKSKRSEMERAAFESKIKFSRKIRRKAKDLRNFEQKVVAEFEQGHIPLEQGRKMVAIIKLLRSQDVEKAEREAEEFYGFLEMGDRLGEIGGLLSKKRAQIERSARLLTAQLSDLEWLDAQGEPDLEKAGRHEKRMKSREALSQAREECARALSSMPLCALIASERAGELLSLGLPMPGRQECEALDAFLRKSGLDGKTAAELLGMIGESEQKLRHLGIDLAGFRQEISGQRELLTEIMFLRNGRYFDDISEGSPALEYLLRHSNAARRARDGLSDAKGTAEEDEREWSKLKQIEKKRMGAGDAGKPGLERAIRELAEMTDILDGKAAAKGDCAGKRPGMLETVLGLFKGKKSG